MAIRNLILVVALTTVSVQAALAQTVPPEGEGAWVLHVTRRGGIMGTGARGFTITSAGSMTCNAPRTTCPSSVGTEVLESLHLRIRLTTAAAWDGSAATPAVWDTQAISTCSDCYLTTLVLVRREPGDVIRTYRRSWDVTTRSRIPDEVLRIHDLVAQWK